MLPLEHFVVALLPVVAYVRVRNGRLPTAALVGVVFVGSQFPDLVDKPLSYHLGLIPSGRVFMHSVPIALPFLLVVALYGWRTGRTRLGLAFGFAHLSHVFADTYSNFLGPDPRIPAELLWPLTRITPREGPPVWVGPDGLNARLWTLFSVAVLSVVLYVLVADVREQRGV